MITTVSTNSTTFRWILKARAPINPENIATAIENNCRKFSTSTTAKQAAASECAYRPSQISMKKAVISDENALPRILYARISRLLKGPGKRKSTSAAENVTAGSPTDVSITIRQYASSAP